MIPEPNRVSPQEAARLPEIRASVFIRFNLKQLPDNFFLSIRRSANWLIWRGTTVGTNVLINYENMLDYSEAGGRK